MFEVVANAAAFGLPGVDPFSRAGAAVQFFIMDVAKIFVLLVAVIYVMGLLRAVVAPERVRAFVHGRPHPGRFRARVADLISCLDRGHYEGEQS